MKTLAELQAIRDKARKEIEMRAETEDGIRVVVGMATCGIAAGGPPAPNRKFPVRGFQRKPVRRHHYPDRMYRYLSI